MVSEASEVQPHDLLRKARQERGWSQLELAERLGTTQPKVARWESGRERPSLYSLRMMCKVLDKTPEELGFVFEPRPHQDKHEDTAQIIQDAVEQVAKADPKNIQEVAASQLAISNSYYLSGLQQSKQSFLWSLIFAGTGIGFFCFATAVVLFRQPTELAYVGTIGGILQELLAGTCLYLYKCATDQLATFRSGLTNMEKLLLANSMCEGLTGEKKETTQAEVIRMIVASATQASSPERGNSH